VALADFTFNPVKGRIDFDFSFDEDDLAYEAERVIYATLEYESEIPDSDLRGKWGSGDIIDIDQRWLFKSVIWPDVHVNLETTVLWWNDRYYTGDSAYDIADVLEDILQKQGYAFETQKAADLMWRSPH
jgi:hypothetical protein